MVGLVILDAIFVLAELLIDLSIIRLEHGHIAPQVRQGLLFSAQEISLYKDSHTVSHLK